jgi:hypothetical protein
VLGGITLRKDGRFLRKSTTFRATPVESRKLWASKAAGLVVSGFRANAGFAIILTIMLAPTSARSN